MAYIKVNHKQLLSAASQVENYVNLLNKNMSAIDCAMVTLNAKWQGDDYRQVMTEWDEIYSSGSTTDRMKTSLKSYVGSIRESAKLYKEAQARAINRANTLCK